MKLLSYPVFESTNGSKAIDIYCTEKEYIQLKRFIEEYNKANHKCEFILDGGSCIHCGKTAMEEDGFNYKEYIKHVKDHYEEQKQPVDISYNLKVGTKVRTKQNYHSGYLDDNKIYTIDYVYEDNKHFCLEGVEKSHFSISFFDIVDEHKSSILDHSSPEAIARAERFVEDIKNGNIKKSNYDVLGDKITTADMTKACDSLLNEMLSGGDMKEDNDFPSFGKVFVEVNKLYNVDDPSGNQQCRLTYDYLHKWYSSKKDKIQSEEPLIVHNVMSYKGKNYLAFKVEAMRCSFCKLDGTVIDESCSKFYKCQNGCFWKEFNDVNISDHLACMRKDIGDIYVYLIETDKIDKLTAVVNSGKSILTEGWRSSIDNVRLATAEELREYFKTLETTK